MTEIAQRTETVLVSTRMSIQEYEERQQDTREPAPDLIACTKYTGRLFTELSLDDMLDNARRVAGMAPAQERLDIRQMPLSQKLLLMDIAASNWVPQDSDNPPFWGTDRESALEFIAAAENPDA